MPHRLRMRKWARVAAVAERQHLLITVWQLRLLGVSDTELNNRIVDHGWKRKTHGVIALPGPDTGHRKLAAAVLAYSRPTGAAERVADTLKDNAENSTTFIDALVEVAMTSGQLVTGLSALWLHGIGAKPPTHTIRLTNKGGHVARRGVRLRLGPGSGGTRRIAGLPVVDVEQAFVDAAAGDGELTAAQSHHALARLLATADAKRTTTLDRLDARIQTMGRFVGRPVLLRVIRDLRGELSHSATEAQARQIVAKVLAKYELVLHPRPFGVKVGSSRTVGEADLAILSLCLDIEIDGPHHLLPAQAAADQQRDRRMRRAGWDVERFSTELVDLSPITFAAQVEECVRFRLGL